MVSYTSVQQMPAEERKRGSAAECRSREPVTAVQPSRAPQLKVKPRMAWG